jgi:hypothetical protein
VTHVRQKNTLRLVRRLGLFCERVDPFVVGKTQRYVDDGHKKKKQVYEAAYGFIKKIRREIAVYQTAAYNGADYDRHLLY